MGTFSGIFTTPPYFGSQCYSFGLGLFRREDPWRCHFRQMLLRWSLVVLALVECTGLQLGSRFGRKCAASLASLSLLWPASVVPLLSPAPVFAKDLPALEKCFNAVRKELDMKNGGESLKRLEHDINEADWDDLKLFTREYDAGFRGGVLKSAWKQLGDQKKRGIEVSNSFTFDLIALNKAGRNNDKEDAFHRLDQIRQDLKDFLALEAAVSKEAN